MNAILPLDPPGDDDGEVLPLAEADEELDADEELEADAELEPLALDCAALPGLPNDPTGSRTTIRKKAPRIARTARASARPSLVEKDDRFKLYLLAPASERRFSSSIPY